MYLMISQVEGLPELADAPKPKSSKAAPKMKRIPSVPGIETDLSKAVRPVLSFFVSELQAMPLVDKPVVGLLGQTILTSDSLLSIC